MKKHFCTYIFCMIMSVCWAQKFEAFSTDTLKFIEEFEANVIQESPNKQEATQRVNAFKSFWLEGTISTTDKDWFMEAINSMRANKLRTHPHFILLAEALQSCLTSQSQLSQQQIRAWKTTVDKLISKKQSRPLTAVLECSNTLFKDGILYAEGAFRYQVYGNSFVFHFDSVPGVHMTQAALSGKNNSEDSIHVQQADVWFYPLNSKFKGIAGRLPWNKSGNDKAYADLYRYTIDARSGNLTADSAYFQGNSYVKTRQPGKIIDKIIHENQVLTYPRFESNSKRVQLNSIYPEVDYEGGFTIRGDNFVGFGTALQPSAIVLKRQNKPFIRVISKNLSMSPNAILAASSAIRIYLDGDSIYHPDSKFTYLLNQDQVSIYRGDDGLQKSPFQNTYHKLAVYVEQILWNKKTDTLAFNFLTRKSETEAFFESHDFFSKDRAEYLKFGEAKHPVFQLFKLYNDLGKSMEIPLQSFCRQMLALPQDLRPLLFKMAIAGLIDYNVDTDEIKIKQKLLDVVDVINKKRDSDNISIHSVFPAQDNAVMNLKNKDLTIRGVKFIVLSDSQRVFVFPKGNQVTLKKNRDMQFDGVVSSGKFEFIGKAFQFSYADFKMGMQNLDSIRIFIEKKQNGATASSFSKLQTLIENCSGELRIDGPTNKSGRLQADGFPMFKSNKESFAYYDSKKTYRGVYDRSKVFFKLDPFTIQNLDNFKNEKILFSGIFNSGGIVPQIKDTLRIMPDLSLGFIKQTPPGGYPMYGGKATFENELRLSNSGLMGNGLFTFSQSKSQVKNFIFFPDSASGYALTYDVNELKAPEFPVVHGDTVKLRYQLFENTLLAYHQKTPFRAYKENVKLFGRLDLTMQHLTGSGRVSFVSADLISTRFNFLRRTFNADTANFQLKAVDEEGLSFSTVNLKSKIDFDNMVGEFINNGKGSFVRFDKNQYIASMDRFKWSIDKDELELGDSKKRTLTAEEEESGVNLEGPEFISVHPKQDSLRFFAPGAKYQIRKYIINCFNVPFIDVADARLIPHNGDVTIYKNAKLDTLENATLIANTVTKYHKITKVKAEVFGRRDYLASGDYQYIDENKKPYQIHFAKIKPDTSGQTVSEGDIPERAQFKFNDFFSFAGNVILYAAQPYLTFKGGTKIVHNCKDVPKSYLNFEGEINPNNIQIPIPKIAKDMNGQPVGTGFVLQPDSGKILHAFVSLMDDAPKQSLFTGEGLMIFDRKIKAYQISNADKLQERNMPGTFIELNTKTCKLNGEGLWDLSKNLGQVKLQTFGVFKSNPTTDSLTMQAMMVLDFFFDNGVLKRMFKDFENKMPSMKPSSTDAEVLTHGLTDILGKERADKALSDLSLYGNYKKFPDELNKSLVLSDIQLRYVPEAQAFASSGMFSIANILKNEVFRYVKGVITIRKLKTGDLLDIYIEPSANTWYYFSYSKGVMLAVSSNTEFNNELDQVKAKNKKQNVTEGPSFRFDLTKPIKKDQYLNRIAQLGLYGNRISDDTGSEDASDD